VNDDTDNDADNNINNDANDDANNDTDEQSVKIRNYNWNNKILNTLKSLKLDIKNKKTNSEV